MRLIAGMAANDLSYDRALSVFGPSMGRDLELPWVATVGDQRRRTTIADPAFSMRDYCGKLCGTSLVTRGASPASLACM